MEINRVTIEPSDVGLKEWDAFYYPELLNQTQALELSGSSLGTKVRMGVLILMLNSPLEASHASRITLHPNPNIFTNTTEINNLVFILDTESALYETEIETVIKQNKFVLDEKELLEQEIIDAYLKEVGNFYSKKRKIIL